MANGNVETNLNILHDVPVFRAEVSQLTNETIIELIGNHLKYQSRYKLLYDYYIGKHSIRRRQVGAGKPNNRLVDNFAEYITSIKTGYFLGNPVVYKSKKEDALKEVQDIFDENDEQDTNHELARLSSIYGHCFELSYLNSDGELKFTYVKPTQFIGIYSTGISGELVAGIRYIEAGVMDDVTFYEVTVYTADAIRTYTGALDVEKFSQTANEVNPLGELPVNEYKNNNDRLSDFENVISLIDAYEVIQSDSTNEVQYFNDAYLVLKDLSATDDQDIADMKNQRVIKLDGEGTAEWLVKNINDTHIQNQLKNIREDIHKFSKTPDLNSEKFASNLSGVAIKYKLWTLEQDIANKERKFSQALKRRIKIILNYLKLLKGKEIDHKAIGMEFKRNIPMNDLENAQMVTLLKGLVSDNTLRGLLSVIHNPKDEAEAVEEQKEKEAEQMGFDTLGKADLNPSQVQQQKEQQLMNK